MFFDTQKTQSIRVVIYWAESGRIGNLKEMEICLAAKFKTLSVESQSKRKKILVREVFNTITTTEEEKGI